MSKQARKEVNPRTALRDQTVMLAHGGGGQLTDELLNGSVFPHLGNDVLSQFLDSGLIDTATGRLALTIDGYVVKPLLFPGGDIGRLAVTGTINDLAVCGAEPKALALGLILEEGLSRETLSTVCASIEATAKEAGVKVITGDTKVVGRGQADGMYITTAGVGIVPANRRVHPDQVQAGDVLIINGPIADHGLAVMLAREMPEVKSVLRSDVAPLSGLIGSVLASVPVVFMRDPTRAGLAGLAADLATRTGLHVVLDEEQIPVRAETRHAAEMLGLDPLEVANEGKVVMVVRAKDADKALAALRATPLGEGSRVIGRIEATRDGICELRTLIGGRRILQKPYGEQLPRIC